MSTAFVKRSSLAPIRYHIYRYCLALLLVAISGRSHSQSPTHAVNMQELSVEMDSLYADLANTPSDNVHRVCLTFMRKYAIRKDANRFNRFCKYLKDRAARAGANALFRRVQLIEMIGQLRQQKVGMEQADEAFESLYYDFLAQDDPSAAVECLFELAQFHHHDNHKIQAIKVLFFAEKVAEKYRLQQDICYEALLHKIGYILWELDKPISSSSYFKRSLATGKGTMMDSLISLNGIGINYQKVDSLQESLRYFDEASRAAVAAGNDVFNTIILGSAAVTLYKLKEYDKAYEYVLREKEVSNKKELWENAAGDFYLMAKIELQRNDPAACRVVLDSFANMMLKHARTDDYASHKKQQEASYLYYEKLQDHKEALAAYKRMMHFDSLFQDQGNKNKISELELKAEVKLYEQEMVDKERAKKMRDLLESIVLVAAFILVAVVIYFLYKKIRRTEKDKNETQKINIQQAAEIEELKLQLLAQLDTIRNENINFQARVAAKEQVQDEKMDEHATTIDHAHAINAEEAGTTTKTTEEVELLKAFNLSQKVQWKDFRTSFNKVYPDFETSISSRIGVVSSAELRLMMLHKLGLSNKEIAQTLLISPDSVKKGKYRLYKKIGINSAEELDIFLGKMSETPPIGKPKP